VFELGTCLSPELSYLGPEPRQVGTAYLKFKIVRSETSTSLTSSYPITKFWFFLVSAKSFVHLDNSNFSQQLGNMPQTNIANKLRDVKSVLPV